MTGSTRVVDHMSKEPLFKQFADILREQIESGALKRGGPIRGETGLMAENGLSRGTVRRSSRKRAT